MNNYNNSGNPEFLNEYLVHLRLVQLLSERSIQGYYEDIRMFLRYVHQDRNDIDCDIEDIDISDFPSEKLRDITVTDIYNFIFYVSDERHNSDKARYRKISSLIFTNTVLSESCSTGFVRECDQIMHLSATTCASQSMETSQILFRTLQNTTNDKFLLIPYFL